MADTSSWQFRPRDYAREQVASRLASNGVGAAEHPLAPRKKKPAAVVVVAESGSSSSSSSKRTKQQNGAKGPTHKSSSDKTSLPDPLSGGAADDPLSMLLGDDPLSAGGSRDATARENQSAPLAALRDDDLNESDDALGPSKSSTKEQQRRSADAAWAAHKQAIIRDFGGASSRQALQFAKEPKRPLATSSSSSQRPPYGTSTSEFYALEEATSASSSLVSSTRAPKMVERSAARLQQLESSSSDQRGDKQQRESGTSQQQQQQQAEEARYVETLDALWRGLQRAWARDERVHALKLAIQTARLLSKPGSYYPSLFACATDVLDAFGTMVYDRVEQKRSKDPVDARETCRNWFYKISCVRELVPRFYAEVALLRCYAFLPEGAGDLPQIVSRLAHVARGFGDPVVAAYARAYLARAGLYAEAAFPDENQQSPKFAKPTMLSTPAVQGGGSSSSKATFFAVTAAHDALFAFQEAKKPRFQPYLSKLFPTTSSQGGDASVKALTAQYVRLIEPATSWLFRCVATRLSESDADSLLAHYRDYCNDATILRIIVDRFDAKLISRRAAAFVALAKRAEPSSTSTVRLLGALGAKFAASPPLKQHRLPVLNEVWKVATRCNDVGDYVECATQWLDCLLKHYTDREVKVLLGDVVAHVERAVQAGDLGAAGPALSTASGTSGSTTKTPSKSSTTTTTTGGSAAATTTVAAAESSSASSSSRAAHRLEDLVQMLVQSTQTTTAQQQQQRTGDDAVSSVVLASDYLLKLLDLFRPHRKVEIAKELLAASTTTDAKMGVVVQHRLTNGHHSKKTHGVLMPPKKKFRDPVLIHTVMEIARVAHDSLDSLSPDGERRHVASLIVGFVDKIDLGRDLERQLGAYVECRAAFPNLDPVLDRLVLLTARLAVAARKISGSSSKTTSSATTARRAAEFSKACLAYCHVTVPSIGNPFRRFALLAHLGHVALLNACLPHADTFFKAAVALVPDLPAEDDDGFSAFSSESSTTQNGHFGDVRLKDLVAQLLSGLIVVPGRPDHGPFYLVQGLLNALPRYQHWRPTSLKRVETYCLFIPLLAAYSQRRLPYSTPGVEANDILYGGSNEYASDLKTHLHGVVNDVAQHLADLNKDPAFKNTKDHNKRCLAILDFANVVVNNFELDDLDGTATPPKHFVAKLLGLVDKAKAQGHFVHPDTLRYLHCTRAKLKFHQNANDVE